MRGFFGMLGVLSCVGLAASIRADVPVDFVREIKPILEQNCVKCHGAEQQKGGFRIDTRQGALKAESSWIGLVPGHPDKSAIYKMLLLPIDDDDVMPPPKEPRLSKGEIGLIGKWISEGAKWPEALVLKTVRRVDFVKDVQPILEFNCVACHREGYAKGSLRLDDRALAFKGGESAGAGIVAGKPEKSAAYVTLTVPVDDERLMPPKAKNGPLPKEQIDIIGEWITQGARWPDGLLLLPKKKEEGAGDERAITASIHKKILAAHKSVAEKSMQPFSISIPGTRVGFDMVPIPSGEFLFGSPDGEKDRVKTEGPQHKVRVSPFWMGKHEVTWNEFELFMYPDIERRTASNDPVPLPVTAEDKLIDAVSRPTKPYVEMSFGMGKDGYPAISMTQHSAIKYCQWLSAKTGQFYRLPTEAEWEYACRAGTKTAYSWGDDPKKIGEYAWFEGNSDFKYQKVGKKKPNPWGLHDIHGNVAEWCLDQYEPDYSRFTGALRQDPWTPSTKPYPHVVKGGSWDDVPAKLRSAARRGSDKSWKIQDPQLPKSIWYHTDAQFLGMRVVRPLKIPTLEEMHRYWNNGVEKD